MGKTLKGSRRLENHGENRRVTRSMSKQEGGLKQEQKKQDCSREDSPDHSFRGGLTQEQRQKYSRVDIPDHVFRGGVLVAKQVYKINVTQIRPTIPVNFIRGANCSKDAVEYYSKQCGKKYLSRQMPIKMKTKVVGGGYLDFITLMCIAAGADACEKLQAIVYTGPGPDDVCEVLMCRPLLSSSPYYHINEDW